MIWDSVIGGVLGLLDKLIVDPTEKMAAKERLLAMQQAGEFKEMDQRFELAKGQIEVNKIEAASSSPFVSGWRPAVGWVCVAGFGYTVLLQPLLPWLIVVLAHPVPPLPDIDTGVLLTLLGGMLGLGTLRTTEKIKGVSK